MRVVMLVQIVDLDDDVCGFIHAWVAALARRVTWLDVLTLRKGKTALPDNVRLHVLKPRGDEGKFLATGRFYQALLGIVRHARPDVIFCHMTPIYSVVAAPIAKLWGIPLVTWYTHETVSLPLRLAEKFSNVILTASPESFRLPSQKVIVTNHGIDTRVFCPRAETPPTDAQPIIRICSIGRISPRKDYETLLKAARIVVHDQHLRHVRFVIVGKEGTAEQQAYFQHLQNLVTELELTDYVEFVGAVPHREVTRLHQQSDIFVNMRQTGGMDKAVLEAMACAVPTVVCNTTFAPLFGSLTSQLIFQERQADDLAQRLSALVQLPPEQRRQIGQALRAVVVQEHDLERLMERVVKIFETL